MQGSKNVYFLTIELAWKTAIKCPAITLSNNIKEFENSQI